VSSVVGIDLSSRALDLARLDETHGCVTHRRVDLEAVGKRSTSWERTLALPRLMPNAGWWDDVYLVAIEAPYGPGTGTVAILNRIVGALIAGLPPRLRAPERCWVVRPDEWKGELGLRGKPTTDDLERVGLVIIGTGPETQDARDAACLAYYAREVNARALGAA
jgi:hypothetical protein